MKISPFPALCAVAFSSFSASCSPPPSSLSRVAVSSPYGSQTALSDQMFFEVNSYRASKGKPALRRHPGLDRLAQLHCDYLVKTGGGYGIHGKTLSHIGFDGRALIAKQKYQITSLGENVVASTDNSPKHLVKLWAGSKGHEHNMVSDWACTGIATAVTSDGQVISTQLFGNAPSTSHRTMADRFSRQW